MKRLLLIASACAAIAAVPASAAKPTYKPPKPPHPGHPAHPGHPTHPTHPSHPPKPPKGNHGAKGEHGKKGEHGHKGHHNGTCTARSHGYRAIGTLMSAALTPGTGKHRFDGTLTVQITKANHKAATGTQTFTLTDARVRFGKGVDSTAPAAGDRVVLHGKVTGLPHGCSMGGFTPAVTVTHLRISSPKRHG